LRYLSTLTYISKVQILFMAGISYQEEMEIVMLKSTHSCYTKTLLIEEGYANCSATH